MNHILICSNDSFYDSFILLTNYELPFKKLTQVPDPSKPNLFNPNLFNPNPFNLPNPSLKFPSHQ